MKKNKIDKRKKSNKIFNHVAKRVHKLSKKQGLGFTWQQSQKFTSANVFQKFKGQAVSKIKVTEIDKVTNSVLEAQKLPFQAIPLPKGKATRPKEICDDVDKIPDVFLEPINWWALPDAIARFPDMVNIEVEFEGIISTGITKKVNLPSMLPIREYFRNSRVSSEVTIIFKKLVRPDRTDDGQPCSYYILATIEGSSFDIETMGQEKKGFVSLKNLTQEERDKIAKQEAEFRAESKAKAKTKKSVKETPRPKQVEAKPSQEPTKKISTARIKEFNRATENLERQFDKKIITRKEFQERLKKLNDSLENGGEV
jgi:hypothetical protein